MDGVFDRVRAGLARVTVLGWTVLALGVAGWCVGYRLGWQEMMVVAGASLLLLLIAALFTIGRLELTAEISVSPPRVVVGERVAGQLRVSNLRSRAARGLRVELPVGESVGVYSFPALKKDHPVDELFIVPTNRRAVIPVGPLTTVKGDPLGVMRRSEVWTEIEEIFVHPKTVPLPTMAAGLIRDMEGQATPQLSPSDVAFHTLREYVPGDDRRHVHWRSSAKIGQLMVRQYVDTRRSHVAVVLSTDLDEYSSEDEFELAVSCAASAALQARRDEQTLSLFVGAHEVVSDQPKRMLDKFSAIEGDRGSGGLSEGVTAARSLAPEASVAVMCVGSGVSIADVRAASSRVSLEAMPVVLRADESVEPGYRVIGTTKFVNVPTLRDLARGLGGVV